jgi:hydrogenase maturation factor HypF (carbamoyltransferase family)
MPTVASFRNSKYETPCEKCGEPLIAPEWSEYVSEDVVHNFWSCTKCGCEFETKVSMPADTKADAEAMADFFPSLLVA